MALVSFRIGSSDNVVTYDDADFDSAIETDQPMKAGAPIDPNDVVILGGLPTLADVVSAAANITDHAVVRGDGGARGIQDSGVIIDDTDNLTLPDGAVYSSHASDHTHFFGHAVIGYIGSGNEAALQHRTLALNGTNYAVKQLNLGTTYVNCSTGRELHFCRNNTSLVTLTELTSLVNNSMVDTLHRHSELSASDGDPDRALVVDATGLVGIGTVGPAYPLDIESSLNTIIRAKSTDNRAGISVEDDDTQAAFGVEDGSAWINVGGGSLGSAEFVIDSIGRIGIGTISPDTKLQVVGNCKFGDDDTNYTLISTTGVLTLVGTARAWKSRDLDPISVRSPGANAPANDQIDNFDFHRYDDEVIESVYFHWGVPDDYGEGTANVRGQFKFVVENPPTTPDGDEVVIMGFEYKIIHEGDVFDFTGGTTSGTLTETIVEDETPWIHHLTAYGTLDTTGLTHGDTILFRFFRDATNGADTYENDGPANNDAWVYSYHLQYITDKLGHPL